MKTAIAITVGIVLVVAGAYLWFAGAAGRGIHNVGASGHPPKATVGPMRQQGSLVGAPNVVVKALSKPSDVETTDFWKKRSSRRKADNVVGSFFRGSVASGIG